MNKPNPQPHLLVFKVNDIQKEAHIYEEIAERIKKAVPSAWQISQNAFLVPGNVQLNEAEDSFFGVLGRDRQYFNFQLSPPVFARCDQETQKRLDSLGLDPYCTSTE
jgi:hypothetical protein